MSARVWVVCGAPGEMLNGRASVVENLKQDGFKPLRFVRRPGITVPCPHPLFLAASNALEEL